MVGKSGTRALDSEEGRTKSKGARGLRERARACESARQRKRREQGKRREEHDWREQHERKERER